MKKELQEETNKIPEIKIIPSFDLIFELLENENIKINIKEHNIFNQNAELTKNETGGFLIEFEGLFNQGIGTIDIEILINNKVFLAPNLYLYSKGISFKKNTDNNFFSGEITLKGNIREIKHGIKCNTNSYNRFIIPSSQTSIDSYLETNFSYRNEFIISVRGKIKISVDNNDVFVIENKHKKKSYFIIDSIGTIDSNLFSEICHSIMIGYGFISADFIQNEAYYFESKDADFSSISHFSYLQLRPSIISNGTCNPIYSNPYGYTKDKSIINQVGIQIKVFDDNLFSILCTKIHNEQDYATLILLILEANISSLILRPAGYSVALEKITNIIVNENKGLKPIPNKKISKEFRKKLKEVLFSLSKDIEEVGNKDSLIILQKNIDKINNPTNRDKLTKPFEIYGISLKNADLKAIDNRNNFLHGRNINIDENTDEFIEIYQISLRLNKLINMLILKHIGFSGIIINHLKHNEKSFNIEINENLFEKI